MQLSHRCCKRRESLLELLIESIDFFIRHRLQRRELLGEQLDVLILLFHLDAQLTDVGFDGVEALVDGVEEMVGLAVRTE
jgi:hypothetical protein